MGKFLCYAVRKDGKFYNIESGQFTDFLTSDCIFDSKENAEKVAEDNAAELEELRKMRAELTHEIEHKQILLYLVKEKEKEKAGIEEKDKDRHYYIKRVRRNKFGTELVSYYLSEWDDDENKVKFCDDICRALELNPDEVGVILKGLLNNRWYSRLKTDYIDEWSFEIVEI